MARLIGKIRSEMLVGGAGKDGLRIAARDSSKLDALERSAESSLAMAIHVSSAELA